MGRVREFEDKKALEKAMFLFWEKGYEQTSLKELLKEMEILNGSFYNTFGNKKNLLLKTLEYYGEEVTQKRGMVLTAHESFKEGLRALLYETFQCVKSESFPRGCLLANSLSHETLEDPEIKSFLLKEIDRYEAFFEHHIEMAIESGELDNDIDSKLAAATLVAYSQGCMKLSGLRFDIQKFKDQTEYFLSSIGL